MRFLPIVAFSATATTAIVRALQDDLFLSQDPSSSEISSLPNDSIFDQYDVANTGSSSPDLLSSDPSSLLSFASTNPAETQFDSSSSEQLELASSSCLGDETSTSSSDVDSTIPWSRRIKRSDNSILLALPGQSCQSTDQPVPFKDALPGWTTKVGDVLKYIWLGEEEYIEDDARKKTLINRRRCEPTHPYNLCCLLDKLGDGHDVVKGGLSNEYWNCNSAFPCLEYDVCCVDCELTTHGNVDGKLCYELSYNGIRVPRPF